MKVRKDSAIHFRLDSDQQRELDDLSVRVHKKVSVLMREAVDLLVRRYSRRFFFWRQ